MGARGAIENLQGTLVKLGTLGVRSHVLLLPTNS